MRLRAIIGAAALAALLAVGGGIVVGTASRQQPVLQVVDGVRVVKTSEAGWKRWDPSAYTDDMLGNLTAEYDWAVGTAPVALPITAGNCGEEQGCSER